MTETDATPLIKYYLAATFADKMVARSFVKRMKAKWGDKYECTARWVFAEDDEEGIKDGILPADSARFASNDLFDINQSQAFVMLFGDRSSPGKIYEAGYAMRAGLPIHVIGMRRPDSVFEALWRQRYKDMSEFIANPFSHYTWGTGHAR